MTVGRGWSHVHLKGDCLKVINALNDRSDDNLHSFGATICACSYLSSSFIVFIYSFIRRSSNCLAHALAHILFSDSYILNEILPPSRFGPLDMI